MSRNTLGAVALLALALCLAAPGLTSATFLSLPIFNRDGDNCVKPYTSCPTFQYDDNTLTSGSCRLDGDELFSKHVGFGIKSAGTGCAPDVPDMDPMSGSSWRPQGYILLPCVGFQIDEKPCKYCVPQEHSTKAGFNMKKMRVCIDEPEKPETPKPMSDDNKPKDDDNKPKDDDNQGKDDDNKPKDDDNQGKDDDNKPKDDDNKRKDDDNHWGKSDHNKGKSDGKQWGKSDRNKGKSDDNHWGKSDDNHKSKADDHQGKADDSKFLVNGRECFHKIKVGGFCGVGISCKCCSCPSIRGVFTDLSGPCTQFGGIKI